MKNKLSIILLLLLTALSCKTIEKEIDSNNTINIEWTSELKGDFSFKENWSYKEGVYKNSHGQLSCDGSCPVAIDRMKDNTGKIYKDSLQAFYKIIDTTHVYHSLKSENRMYEYSGTNYIEFKKLKNGTIKGESQSNVSTHSNLIIELKNDSCTASVYFNSIRDLGINTFPLKSGTIKIDEALYESGIIKAVFDFKFINILETDNQLYWKGNIYSKIITE
ncbi:hypothetical protein SAMN04488007_2062 [Maribacter aquivivus]|uniref:Lipoprotein n=1 Tax=Maribacter aquivivus TaxID=228958 RepID=A0A1M6NHY9_9FLAO|nr:hypothetical protein [Maribacter aquivivus]SHJ95348.1 hypothetical protein SAMN04488007_2062 [Maribacter aquivivus]